MKSQIFHKFQVTDENILIESYVDECFQCNEGQSEAERKKANECMLQKNNMIEVNET